MTLLLLIRLDIEDGIRECSGEVPWSPRSIPAGAVWEMACNGVYITSTGCLPRVKILYQTKGLSFYANALPCLCQCITIYM